MSTFISYYWQFGDGKTSAEEIPRHKYNMPGEYTIKLEAKKESGRKLTTTLAQTVTDWSDATDGLNVSHTNTVFKFALKPQQGIDISECTGDDLIFTEGRAGTLKVKDDQGQYKQYVLDDKEKLWYHVSTRTGPEGSGITKIWKDREGTDLTITGITLTGTDPVSITAATHDLVTGDTVKFASVGGATELNGETYTITRTDANSFTLDDTDSSGFTAWTSGGTATEQGTWPLPSLERGEDRGAKEHFFIHDMETHIHTRPENEENRDEDGYDSDGYVDGLEFSVDVYADGEPTTADATTTDVSKSGEAIANKEVMANRLRYKISANRSEHIFTEASHYFKVEDITADPDSIQSDEIDYELELASDLVAWISRDKKYLRNLASGNDFSAGAATQITGPDTKSNSGINITTAVSVGNSLIASGYLSLWHKTGYTISGITLTQHDTIGTWILSYASGAIPASLELGTGNVADFRLYDASKGSAARTYYYNDVKNNSGDIVMGVF